MAVIIGSLAFAAGLGAIALAITQVVGGDGDATTACGSSPSGDSIELVYRLDAREGVVSTDMRDETIEILCRRFEALGASAFVGGLAGGRIRVIEPKSLEGGEQRAIDRVGIAGRLHLYDWEPNLIGRERTIGGFPGSPPPGNALREANEEWEAAGRSISSPENQQLIFSGAYPTAYGAVQLASEQEPDPGCEACSIDVPRYYLFSRDEDRRLLAGPELSKENLFVDAAEGERARDGIVKTVPPGTIVVSEQPSDPAGKVLADAEPGWYALKDRPALSGLDIEDPRQGTAQLTNEPSISFDFTDEGRRAFHELTRQIAQRGLATRIGPVTGEEAVWFSHHFAIVVDDVVRTRPIIDFSQSPDGIDGRAGAQIAGGFTTAEEAGALAAFLRIGPLPVDLVLVDRRELGPPTQGE